MTDVFFSGKAIFDCRSNVPVTRRFVRLRGEGELEQQIVITSILVCFSAQCVCYGFCLLPFNLSDFTVADVICAASRSVLRFEM
jgi:hypothetical protein